MKVNDTAKTAAEIESKLGKSAAAPPGMSTNAEDQARQGFESGRSDYQVNYPFVYPSAAEVGEDFQKNMGWARYPRSVKDKESRPPLGGINIGVSKYGETPDLAFEAAKCIASEQHQGDAAELGGLPPTTESVYETEQVKKAYPFADLLRESIEAAAPRPVTPAYSDISLAIQKTYSPPDGVDPNGIVREAQRPDRESGGREDLLMEAAQPQEQRPSARRRRRPRRGSPSAPGPSASWPGCCARPAVIAMLIVTGYPIGYAVYLSLQRYDLRFPDDKEFVGLSNYSDVLTSSTWWGDVWNTVVITVVSVSLELVLGMAIALVMHRAIFGRGPVRAAILIPYGIITVVAAFAWKYAFDPTSGFVAGLPLISDTAQPLNTHNGSMLVIILAEVWKTTPFMALLLLAGLALVPDELHEAAKVDGASTVAALLPDHDPADEAGDPGGAAVPHARRVPDLRQHLHHPTGRRAQHRERVDPRLQRHDQPGQRGAGLGDLDPDLHLRDPDRHLLREGARDQHGPAARGDLR